MDTEVKLYRANQLYKMLNISNSTLYLWVKQDKFPAPIKRGGSSFWRADQVNSWIEDGVEDEAVTEAIQTSDVTE